jgi:hypothetical protein
MSKIYAKLGAIQSELKAPKTQVNKFANFNYRNVEDIYEAVKPLLAKHKCTLTLQEDICEVGHVNRSMSETKSGIENTNNYGRVYIKAMATLTDIESGEQVTNSAFAREAIDKKGMDDAQITGTSTSYARKYALGGLFLLDDTKDVDSEDNRAVQTPTLVEAKASKPDAVTSAPKTISEMKAKAPVVKPAPTPVVEEVAPVNMPTTATIAPATVAAKSLHI